MGTIDRTLSMGNRERMVRTCLNKDVDRLPFWCMLGPWSETIVRWQNEGYTGDYEMRKMPFDFDAGFEVLPVQLGFCPHFELKVLHDDGIKRTIQNEFGITLIHKIGHSAIPQIVSSPVTTRDDWEKIKTERLNPDSPERFPQNWQKVLSEMKERDAAVQIGVFPYGLFGTLRDLMGVEPLLLNFYEEPELIHDMMDYLTDFWIAIYTKALRDMHIDHIHIWEDMSGKNGPLISPAMFREFMQPNYEKIVRFARENNIPVVSVDTDGNMDIMMPLLEESGINLVLPFEVQAGCDIVEIKKKYPNICLHGGIDKRRLTFGFTEIDAELDRIGDLFCASGYIPALDHTIHPEISYENFCYFITRLKEKIGGLI